MSKVWLSVAPSRRARDLPPNRAPALGYPQHTTRRAWDMGKDADSSDTATISSTITSATAGGGVGGSGGAPAVGGRGSAAVAAPSAPGEELKSAVGVLTTLLAFSLLMVLAPTASFTASLQGYLDRECGRGGGSRKRQRERTGRV
eukprot:366502-Chlamydomonas_euryale.AAC.7